MTRRSTLAPGLFDFKLTLLRSTEATNLLVRHSRTLIYEEQAAPSERTARPVIVIDCR
jgi:hypothetical protein